MASVLPPRARPGRFIVLEGGDGAGRSTQVRLLLSWLQNLGWPTCHAGLGRSALAARAFREYQGRPGTGPHALALLYAADLTAQAEGMVHGALEAGFAVIADRWTGTALARCASRGVERAYLEEILPNAPEPDLTVHLHARPRLRLEREITRGGLPSVPESGRDLPLSADPLRSFIRYQSMLDRELRRLARLGGERWCTVSSADDPARVQQALRRVVAGCLGEGDLR